jgi:hypothetical protein
MNRRYFAIFPDEPGTDNLSAAETEDKPLDMFEYRELRKTTIEQNLILAAKRIREAGASAEWFSGALGEAFRDAWKTK